METVLKEVVFQDCQIGGETKELALFVFDDKTGFGNQIIAIPRKNEYIAHKGDIFSISMGHIKCNSIHVSQVKKFPDFKGCPTVIIQPNHNDYYIWAKIEGNNIDSIYNCDGISWGKDYFKCRILKKLIGITKSQDMYIFKNAYKDREKDKSGKLFFCKDNELIPTCNGILSISYFDFIENKECIGKRKTHINNIHNIRWNDRALRADAEIDGVSRVLVIDLEMLKHGGVIEFRDNELRLNWAVVN